MMRTLIGLWFLILSTTSILAGFGLHGSQFGNCPNSTNAIADGCAGANLSSEFINPNFFSTTAPASGQTYASNTGGCTNTNCHPPWSVAGVDYKIGYYSAQSPVLANLTASSAWTLGATTITFSAPSSCPTNFQAGMSLYDTTNNKGLVSPAGGVISCVGSTLTLATGGAAVAHSTSTDNIWLMPPGCTALALRNSAPEGNELTCSYGANNGTLSGWDFNHYYDTTGTLQTQALFLVITSTTGTCTLTDSSFLFQGYTGANSGVWIQMGCGGLMTVSYNDFNGNVGVYTAPNSTQNTSAIILVPNNTVGSFLFEYNHTVLPNARYVSYSGTGTYTDQFNYNQDILWGPGQYQASFGLHGEKDFANVAQSYNDIYDVNLGTGAMIMNSNSGWLVPLIGGCSLTTATSSETYDSASGDFALTFASYPFGSYTPPAGALVVVAGTLNSAVSYPALNGALPILSIAGNVITLQAATGLGSLTLTGSTAADCPYPAGFTFNIHHDIFVANRFDDITSNVLINATAGANWSAGTVGTPVTSITLNANCPSNVTAGLGVVIGSNNDYIGQVSSCSTSGTTLVLAQNAQFPYGAITGGSSGNTIQFLTRMFNPLALNQTTGSMPGPIATLNLHDNFFDPTGASNCNIIGGLPYSITGISGTSSPYTVTATGIPAQGTGTVVNVTGVTPSSLDGVYTLSYGSAIGSFTATTAATGTYTSGGTAYVGVNILSTNFVNNYNLTDGSSLADSWNNTTQTLTETCNNKSN